MRKKVLVIGAAGKIAGQVLPALRARYELTLLDVRAEDRSGRPVEDIQIEDIGNSDRDGYRAFFSSADAVVHFGFVHPEGSGAEARFRSEMRNVEMAYNVYMTASEEGVGRVVVASSNHAADYYEKLILDGAMDVVHPEDRALSDNYYGWAKEAYEHLGFVFAAGQQTDRSLPNVQIRIGGPRENDIEQCPLGDLRCMRRALGAYISERDMQQLFVKSIEVEDIADERGVPFQVFYGISDNSHSFWSIANARTVIGYAPRDNSERRFAASIAAHLRAARDRDGYPGARHD